VEDWQRKLVGQITDQVDAYRAGSLSVQQLLVNAMGLIDAADLHGPAPDYVEFCDRWLGIQGENELLTRPWSRPEWASNARLDDAVSKLREWAAKVGLPRSLIHYPVLFIGSEADRRTPASARSMRGP
jgi:hypothetical protein